MINAETLETLFAWTPYLLGGFGWNLLIALTAGLIGLLVGSSLAFLRQSGVRPVARSSQALSRTIHNLPTFALIFYTAVMLPSEISLPGTAITLAVPAWFKASLALSAMQIGYTSDNLSIAIGAWRAGQHLRALLFIPGWLNGFIITVIASSNASVVGVDELISRCNNVINASGHTTLMIPIYLYGMLFFLCFCFPLSVAMRFLKKSMTLHFVRSAEVSP